MAAKLKLFDAASLVFDELNETIKTETHKYVHGEIIGLEMMLLMKKQNR